MSSLSQSIRLFEGSVHGGQKIPVLRQFNNWHIQGGTTSSSQPPSQLGTQPEPFDGPIMIITLGPTGSGKGTLPQKTLNYLHSTHAIKSHIKLSSFTPLLIDDYIEHNSSYKHAVLEMVREACGDSNELCDKMSTAINTLDPKLLHEFATQYFKHRKQPNCNANTALSCDELLDQNLKRAIQNHRNIVFEATGSYVPKWIFSKDFLGDSAENLNSYLVVFVWSVVDACELIKRNQGRAVHSLNAFLDNPKSLPAPRLPDVRRAVFLKNVKLIESTIQEIIRECVTGECGAPNTRAIVIDNNTYKPEILFDSTRPQNDPVTHLYKTHECGE